MPLAAKIMGTHVTDGSAGGPAGASRAKSPLRVHALQAGRLRSDFAQGRIFALALRFDLDGPPLRCGSIKAHALRGNEKILPCPGVPPGLEAPASSAQNFTRFLPIARGLDAYRAMS
jgi:hypothetical protein